MTSARVVLGALSGAVLLAVAGPALAQERPYDWTLNVNDNGHDPTPVNGTVVYSASV